MRILHYFLNVIFPFSCAGCGKLNTQLCKKCIQNLRPSDYTNNLIQSIFSYKDPVVRKILHNLKYKGQRELATILGTYIYDVILEEINEDILFGGEKQIVIISIPIHKKRKRKRGFNQADLLAKAIVNIDKNKTFLYIPNALKKIKSTRSQVKVKNRNERLKNVHLSFTVSNSVNLKNKKVIVVDDITTTGATFKEAVRALNNVGVKKIKCIAIAH